MSRAPKIGPLRSMSTRVRAAGQFDTSAPIDPQWRWTLRGQGYPIYVLLESRHLKVHPLFFWGQSFTRSACLNSQMHRMTSEWSWTPNGQKYFGKYLPQLGPKFCPFCFTATSFRDICHIIIPHWLVCKTTKKKWQNSNIWNFTIPSTTW